MQRLIGESPRQRVVSLCAFIALVSILITASFSEEQVVIGGVTRTPSMVQRATGVLPPHCSADRITLFAVRFSGCPRI